MAEHSTQNREPKEQEYARGSAKEWLFSIAAGLLGALATATAAIRNQFYSESKNWAGMADIRARNGDGDVIEQGLISKHETALFKNDLKFKGKPEQWKEHAASTREIKRTFARERAELFEKQYGVLSLRWRDFIKGTWQRLERIGTGTRYAIASQAFAVAIAAAVGAYNLVVGLATRAQAKKIEGILLREPRHESIPSDTQESEKSQSDHHTNRVSHRERLNKEKQESALSAASIH